MDLENISSDIMDKVITEMNSYDYNSFSDEDIATCCPNRI